MRKNKSQFVGTPSSAEKYECLVLQVNRLENILYALAQYIGVHIEDGPHVVKYGTPKTGAIGGGVR